MLSGSTEPMFDTADGSVTTVEITALQALGGTLQTGLILLGNEFELVLPANATEPVEEIVDTAGRETPSLISSRRIKQFLIG